jgi:hypothetical protein
MSSRRSRRGGTAIGNKVLSIHGRTTLVFIKQSGRTAEGLASTISSFPAGRLPIRRSTFFSAAAFSYAFLWFFFALPSCAWSRRVRSQHSIRH